MKKRVKCANCGMVYDIKPSEPTNISYQEYLGVCPRCKSNAHDLVKIFNDVWKQE